MAKTETEKTGKGTVLWRKPIVLDTQPEEDPLEGLYVGSVPAARLEPAAKRTAKPERKTAAPRKPAEAKPPEKPQSPAAPSDTNRIAPETLRTLLRIRSDEFVFTDAREVLRGKSFEMYVFLRRLAGETGKCKMRHLELMERLDISRPTLFKQGDWLTKLGLIRKIAVPGDHLGTSYVVYRIEDVLPLPDPLLEQVRREVELPSEDPKSE